MDADEFDDGSSGTASEEAVDAVRALAFGWKWPPDYRPTWGELRELDGPEYLEQIDHVRVCDATLKYLRYTPNIKVLDLMSSKVTDEGMVALKYAPRLERLFLNNTRVGDEGVKQLLGHKNLKVVVAMHARVTIVGERLLNASIPGCRATVGRNALRGVVVASEGSVLKVDILDRVDRITAIIPDTPREDLSSLLANPIGQWVMVRMGEADEPNWIWRITSAPQPPWGVDDCDAR